MDLAGKRVLVTGATGMTGSFIAEYLLEQGAAVRALCHSDNRGWLADNSAVEWFQHDLATELPVEAVQDIDLVLHLASVRRNVAYHLEHADEVAEANVALTMSLVKALQYKPVPVVFFSTANIPPVTDQEFSSPDGYVQGKWICEQIWSQWSASCQSPLLILRPVNMYGPRDTFAVTGNVIPALIIKAEQSSGSVTVWGSGRQQRRFLYVEDVPPALAALLAADVTGTWSLHPAESITIAQLAEQVVAAVQPDITLEYDTSKPEGALEQPLLSLPEVLAQYPWTSLEAGLKKTLAWHDDNRYPTANE